MAYFVANTYICLAIILVHTWCSTALQCYVGSQPGNAEERLASQTCSSATYQQTVVNSTVKVNATYGVGRQVAQNLSFCVIFSFTDEASPHTNHSCDDDSLCHTDGLQHNVTLKGSRGSLYCCSTDRCNDLAALNPATPVTSLNKPPELTCYKTASANGSLVQEVCRTSFCINSTDSAGSEVVTFGCDLAQRCNLEKVAHGKCDTAHDIIRDSTVRICCCNRPLCNGGAAGSGSGGVRALHPDAPLPSSPASHSHPSRVAHVVFIGGVLGATCLAVLLVALVAVLLKKFRRRSADQLEYSYAQLTQELADDREIDSRMLVG